LLRKQNLIDVEKYGGLASSDHVRVRQAVAVVIFAIATKSLFPSRVFCAEEFQRNIFDTQWIADIENDTACHHLKMS
jgi:hypothetical protein